MESNSEAEITVVQLQKAIGGKSHVYRGDLVVARLTEVAFSSPESTLLSSLSRFASGVIGVQQQENLPERSFGPTVPCELPAV
jgi:hypothetical protein